MELLVSVEMVVEAAAVEAAEVEEAAEEADGKRTITCQPGGRVLLLLLTRNNTGRTTITTKTEKHYIDDNELNDD